MSILSERLKEQRVIKKLTQADISKKMHIGQSTYASWETGKYVPDYEKLIWLCDFYNVSIDYMLGRTDNLIDTKSDLLFVSEDSIYSNSSISENKKILKYYHRLDEEDRDYIRGMMIKLYKEKSLNKDNSNVG